MLFFLNDSSLLEKKILSIDGFSKSVCKIAYAVGTVIFLGNANNISQVTLFTGGNVLHWFLVWIISFQNKISVHK